MVITQELETITEELQAPVTAEDIAYWVEHYASRDYEFKGSAPFVNYFGADISEGMGVVGCVLIFQKWSQ